MEQTSFLEKVKRFFGRVQYNSPVILTFSLLAFAALLLQAITGGWTDNALFSVCRNNGSLADPLFYVRLFGHVLGHFDFEHYVNNFIIILLAGPMLEEKYGSKRLALMIVITAFVTGLIHLLFASPNTALMGASGIGFMMILLASFVNLKRGRIPATLILCVVVFIGREIVSGLATADNVSQLTHILGGLCGAAFGFFVNKEKFLATTHTTGAASAEKEE